MNKCGIYHIVVKKIYHLEDYYPRQLATETMIIVIFKQNKNKK